MYLRSARSVEYNKRTESADSIERFSELKRLIFMHFCIILHYKIYFLFVFLCQVSAEE